MKEVHTDNIQVMRGLIYAKEDQLPLLKGDTETRESIEVLSSKNVLLLISDMKITDEELFILKKMYRESQNDPTRAESQYEMVWIPVVDRSTPWTHAKQDQFENCQLRMPWYSVYHPLMIDIGVIKYIQEEWQFKKNPIIVVFDPQGKLINNNALHIIWIWGGHAFPFSSSKEAELWAHETWTFEILAGSIDAAIPIWRAEDNYVCLYGGGNMDWIKKFTTTAQKVAEAASIKLQILYVGESNPEEQIRENISIITVEKLSYSLQDLTLVRFFWERLKSTQQSRMHLPGAEENDPVMQEINTILSFDKKEEGWAVFCRGSDMAVANSENILRFLSDFDLWRTYMNENEFVTALKHYHHKLLLVQQMVSPHKDNMEVLRALIHAKEDQKPLFKGDAKETASIEVLKSKIVLLLISNEEFANEELLFMLKKMYTEYRQDPERVERKYEVVWIPVVDRSNKWNEARQQRFENHQSNMPWYSVYDPSLIDPAIIIYIPEVRHINKKPILAVLDSQGNLVNNNALHILWIWGMQGFPFTSASEAELWKQQTWGIKFLADSINEDIPNWIAKDNYICLYGGENIDWIKKFTAKAQKVAEAAHIELQILYVGKNNPGEQIYENISTITAEKLSYSLQDLTLVRFFWQRLNSMYESRRHLGHAEENVPRTEENDHVIQEINTIRSFDERGEGWAVFCKGSDMAIAKSEKILQCLNDFDLWRTYMSGKEFVTALKHYHRKLLLVQLMESPHKDNMEVLRTLIHAEEDQKPLFKGGDARESASIEVLKNKTVVFLISDAEFADEELLFMPKKMYEESRQFEMVWIPVVDRSTPWNQAKENQFLIHQFNMPWYSVRHHSIIDLAVVMYIEQMWNFKKKPILVVLDPRGKLVNNNAPHMFWIWGSLAFPFTSEREAELWNQQAWGIKLLADSINEAIPSWIAEENNICLYGGGNMDWIKKFIAKALEVAEAAHIKLQILYVGKSNPEEQIQGNISTITAEKHSHSLQDLPLVRFFWKRLKMICNSRAKLGFTLVNDAIVQEINTILSFDEKDEGWAVFCRGSDMAIVKSENILKFLSNFDSWRTYMIEKDFVTALNNYDRKLLKEQLMESPHKDNMEVLRALIHVKEDQKPLFKGDAKKTDSIAVLKTKTVLLLISKEEFSDEELFMLSKTFEESRQDKERIESQYEMVWIPVVDRSTEWNEARQQRFNNHQSKMPWYSVYNPLLINPAVIIYIQEVQQFNEKPILVVLDPQGKLVNNNALHMLWIWGMQGFPFTSVKEAELWKQQTWGIKLLADSIYEDIPNWRAEDNCVCLYGGGDTDWIKKFTTTAQRVAEATHIKLQILYVGKSNPGERIRNNISTITVEKLSYSLQDLTLVWVFWERLKSMKQSKMQLKFTVQNDPIMQGINSILSYDEKDEGWAMFCRGSAMAMDKSEIIVQCLTNFDLWGKYVNDQDFVIALSHYNRKISLAQLMESQHLDNMNVMRELIYAKEGQLPLLKGDTKTMVSIEVLKSKTVLLLISDATGEEPLFMLKEMYEDSRQFEMVWIPVVDRSTPWTEAQETQFLIQQWSMPWYSVCHHSIIDLAVVMYIVEVWNFKKKPILVVLDSQGKLVNSNALHMLWIWGSLAFPFTSAEEEELWKQGIKLLADSIYKVIPDWMAEENYGCLYGGGNIDWIKKFTAKAKAIAEAAHIKLQILYVGKSNPGEQIQGNISTITVEKLSHSLQDLPLVWFFWERLKMICNSRTKLGCTLVNDAIFQEINTILSFDEKDEGWAVFCRVSDMAIAKSENIMQCLSDFDLWRTYMKGKEFVTALKHYHRKLLLVQLIESLHKDNMEVLRALIHAGEDQKPLFKGGDARERASVEVLKNKTLLFFISDVDFDDEELLFMLKKMYEESHQFELVWIPIVDWSTPTTVAEENQFLIYQCTMPWYSPSKLSQIDLAVIMYIEQVWNFKKEPILVVLDPQGKLINNNALHMLWIWGSLAFPFTSTRKAELWTLEISRIQLLADSIDATIPFWIKEENYICLYGGENIDWIREFTATALKVAEAASIPLQILYVGKSNSNEEQVRKIVDTVTLEKLSHSLQEYHQVWFFWQRLKRLWHSKTQLGCTVENDPLLLEINSLLSFDKNHEGWAVFCRGTAMAMAKGETILQCLKDFDSRKTHMEDKDFVTALNHHLNQLQKSTSMGETEHN
ncbi:hypothetical protein Patl1_33430 [Pistacia atlantica]|uniref:Uncharacterized protein n=1 Tax=Pistacia atlantica TaxID=434234 RepID=A0ACC0ZUR0_9ROSI|nr:hypothetical protein Patl1_33430 [Pistacia atlantica]